MDSAVKQQVADSFKFGELAFSMSSQELRRNGESNRLQMQPAKVLNSLLTRAGEVVTREELRKELWSDGIHVDYDDALNHSIKYLRDALGDNAAMPRYIETIPKRGYRFIATVERPDEIGAAYQATTQPASANAAAVRPGTAWMKPAAVLLLMALAFVTWRTMTEAKTPRVKSVTQLTHFGRATSVVTDGTRIYLEQEQAGHHTLAVMPADGSAEPEALATPFENTGLLDISPDNKDLLIAGYDSHGSPATLWRMPTAGGSPRRVGDVFTTSAKWSADGRSIAFGGRAGSSKEGVYVADSAGTAVRQLAEGGAQIDSWSRDGKWLRYTVMNQATGGMAMWEVSAEGGQPRPLFPERRDANARWGEGQCCGSWSVDGKYFFFREGSAHRIVLLAARGATWPRGSHEPTEMYAASVDIDNYTVPAMTPDGHRLFFVGRSQAQELLRFDASRHEFVPYLTGVSPTSLRWSPDGQSIVYSTLPDMTLWRSKPGGSDRMQLTSPPMQAFGPEWSPDGKHIAFHTLLPGKLGKICIIPADGGKPEILLPDEPTGEDAQNWSPDGNVLLFGRAWLDGSGKTTGESLWMLDMRDRKLQKVAGSDGIGSAVWSPDGKQMAALSEDGLRLMLFDVRAQKWTQAASGVSLQPPQWSHDSLAIYFQDSRVSEDQPIYRLTLATHKVQEVASRKQILRSDVGRYQIIGLTPQDEPIARVIHNNADVYALDVELP